MREAREGEGRKRQGMACLSLLCCSCSLTPTTSPCSRPRFRSRPALACSLACLPPQVWVYGSGFKGSLVAVVVPNRNKLMSWMMARKMSAALTDRIYDICENKAAKAHVLAVREGACCAGRRGGRGLVVVFRVCGRSVLRRGGAEYCPSKPRKALPTPATPGTSLKTP